MPPKKQHDDAAAIKEKLQGARDRRNGRANAVNGSNLKEVDNASVHSGQTNSDSNSSNVRLVGFGLTFSTTVASARAWPHARLTALNRSSGRRKTRLSYKATGEHTASTRRPRSRTR
jgi:hypothetical protein